MISRAAKSRFARVGARLRPADDIDERQRGYGMRLVLIDGLTSQAMETLASGLFLMTFAVALGASNLTIGLLAAIPSLAQVMQVPGVVLVERLRARRLVTVLAAFIGRCSLLGLGLGLVLPADAMLPVVIIIALISAVCGSIAGCSWNSWMRDLLPPDAINRFFARRMMYSSVVAITLSLAVSGTLADSGATSVDERIALFSVIGMFGGLAGLVGVSLLARTPERKMAETPAEGSLRAQLTEPLRHSNFRNLVSFFAVWHFAANLATPFFTVYMLKTLELKLSTVTLLVIAGQIANLASVTLWARVADSVGSKAALAAACQLFLICLPGWSLVGAASSTGAIMPLLVGLHLVMGAATAGIALGATSLALRSAPPDRATSFLAVNAVVTALAAGLAPLGGGLLADHLAALPHGRWQVCFGLACLIGLFALSRLRLVHQEGA